MSSFRRGTLRRRISLALGGAVLCSVSTLAVAGVASADVNTPPDPPTVVGVTVSASGVELQWTPPANPGTDALGDPATVDHYNVYLGTQSGGEDPSPACTSSTTTCDLTGLTPGTTYFYEVTTVNSAGLETTLPTTESSVAYVLTPGLSLSSTPSSATFGQPVTLIATLDSPVAGSVAFTVNGNGVAGCGAQDLETATAPYVATCSYTPVSAASFSVGATFTPSDPSSYNGATATPVSVTVNPASSLSNFCIRYLAGFFTNI